MRIWAFPSFYPFDYPGYTYVGIFGHRQYKGLLENGADLKVINPVLWNPGFPFSLLHPEWEGLRKIGFPAERTYDGVKVYHPRIANMRPSRLQKKTYEERYIDSIVNFFKDNKIVLNSKTDIFYSQWLLTSMFVQKAAHKLGIKSAILGIGDDVITWAREKEEHFQYFDKLVTEADLRFFNADYLGREMNNIVGKDLPYNVIYFGVDYNAFKPVSPDEAAVLKRAYNIPADKVIVLTIASPLVRKGWLDLFDALSEVKKKNGRFVLVGAYAGPKDLDIAAEVEKRGLTDNFVNLGEVKPEDLSKLYNTADIFCLPSHWEGLATVISESMSSGLPVITTNVCGHPEIVENGVTGILIPPKQKELLASELLSLINDKGKRDYLGANARNFIVTKWGNFSDNAVKLYSKLEEILST